jgi:hypothetical protein
MGICGILRLSASAGWYSQISTEKEEKKAKEEDRRRHDGRH